jgi:hypothetical protein
LNHIKANQSVEQLNFKKQIQRPSTAFTNLRSSSLIKQKFKNNEKVLDKFIPNYENEEELISLKIEGESVLEREKFAVKRLQIKKDEFNHKIKES